MQQREDASRPAGPSRSQVVETGRQQSRAEYWGQAIAMMRNAAQGVADAAASAGDTLTQTTTRLTRSVSDALPDAQALIERGTQQARQVAGQVADSVVGGVAQATAMTRDTALTLWQRRGNTTEEAARIETDKKAQLLQLIDELEKHPTDRLRLLSEIGITVLGGLAGYGAAGTLATAAGATSIPMLTAAGAWLGVTVVAATPVGWTVGAAAAGAAVAYGVTRLVRSGSKSEARMDELRRRYQEQVRVMQEREQRHAVTDADKTHCIVAMRALIEQNRLPADTARRLMAAVESGKMPVTRAYQHLAALAAPAPEPVAPATATPDARVSLSPNAARSA